MPLAEQPFARPWSADYQTYKDGLTPVRNTVMEPVTSSTWPSQVPASNNTMSLFATPTMGRASRLAARHHILQATSSTQPSATQCSSLSGRFRLERIRFPDACHAAGALLLLVGSCATMLMPSALQ